MFHRTADAALDVIPSDGRGKLFKDLVERGEVERDMMGLVREHGIEAARGKADVKWRTQDLMALLRGEA